MYTYLIVGKNSEINIFGNYNENCIWKLNFGILSMHARVRVIITGKPLWHWFFEKNPESERKYNIYLRKLPTIQ